VYHRDTLHVARVLAGRLDLLDKDGMAPLRRNGNWDAAAPLHDLHHPVAEKSVMADDEPIPRLQQVDEGRLHPRRAGAGNRERGAIRRPERHAQEPPDLRGDLRHDGIEVPNDLGAHGAQDPILDVAGPGPEQEPKWRLKGLGHGHSALLSRKKSHGAIWTVARRGSQGGGPADTNAPPRMAFFHFSAAGQRPAREFSGRVARHPRAFDRRASFDTLRMTG
jgi:hypothetical protein